MVRAQQSPSSTETGVKPSSAKASYSVWHVLRHAAAAQGRTRRAELHGFLSGHDADAHRALFHGVVVERHLFEAAHFGFQHVEFVENPALVLAGKVLAHAADDVDGNDDAVARG